VFAGALLVEANDGTRAQFVHGIVREQLVNNMSAVRRRTILQDLNASLC